MFDTNYKLNLPYFPEVYYGLLLLIAFSSCNKFLDKKPVLGNVIPTNLNDLQTLIDNNNSLNGNSAAGLLELIADNFYLTTNDWQFWASINSPIIKAETQHYLWDANAIPYDNSWNFPYQNCIYYSNIVLDQLSAINVVPGEEARQEQIRGAALFYRAYAFQLLAQLYCKPYAIQNENDLGIVLRLTSNVSEKSTRATVKQTYDQIIKDLVDAASNLPASTTFPTQPSKAAAFAALARTYLSMRDYENAAMYSNLAISSKGTLIDYNLILGQQPVFTAFNDEVIFHSTPSPPILTSSSYAKIDSTLYWSYDSSDLRKIVFFSENTGANVGTYRFRGSYYGNFDAGRIFDGLTSGEMYLIRAECYARAGKVNDAMNDLNSLMVKRWKKSNWIPFSAANADSALNLILNERRKELVWRGLRWSDIRRLNLENYNISIKRRIAGTDHILPPNDLRTVMLIPQQEINYSGIEQNPR